MIRNDLAKLQECMLKVLDNPTEKRIIVQTNIPSLNEVTETIYYMIDRADWVGDSFEVKEIDEWRISNSEGAGTVAPENQSVILLFSNFSNGCLTDIYVESY